MGLNTQSCTFLLYVDVHPSLMHDTIVQYADKTTLCVRDYSQAGLEQQTFIDTKNCVQDFNILKIQTNSSKPNVLNFAMRPMNSQYGLTVMLAHSILEEIYSSKFLGILDQGLTWSNHIDHVYAKLS
ncbi:hypothetical protein J6590_062878 [Homalodisca vitripennis]|nr:hypothetical protein J6590_062878 [Homalodisca vitripennis]